MATFAISISRPVGEFFFQRPGIILYRPLRRETKSTYRFEKESHVRKRNLDFFRTVSGPKGPTVRKQYVQREQILPKFSEYVQRERIFSQIFGDTLFAVQRFRLHDTQYVTPEPRSVLILILRSSRPTHSTETFYSTEP